MAVEKKRGCGYRKVGWLYLCGDGPFKSCDRLPFRLEVCPTCGTGFTHTRGVTWVNPADLLEGEHLLSSTNVYETVATFPCLCNGNCCPVCQPHLMVGKAILLWVGAQHYTPAAFVAEANSLGISRRVKTVPRGFVLGETFVLLAHIKAVAGEASGIFMAFKPKRIEQLVKESEATPEKVAELAKRGITAVPVPDDDPDHAAPKA